MSQNTLLGVFLRVGDDPPGGHHIRESRVIRQVDVIATSPDATKYEHSWNSNARSCAQSSNRWQNEIEVATMAESTEPPVTLPEERTPQSAPEPVPKPSPSGTNAPSPWLATIIGVLGVTLGGTSLLWNVYVYKLDRPGFIIDCARDFDPPGFGTMGRGAPSGAYYVYDNRTNEVTIPCKIINVGQKTEVVRRIESTLKVLDINAPSAPIDAMTIGGKAFQDVAFT